MKAATCGTAAPYSRAVALQVVVRGSGWHGWQARLVALVDRLAALGGRPYGSRDERLRCATLIFGSLLIAVLSVVWVVTYLAYARPSSADTVRWRCRCWMCRG